MNPMATFLYARPSFWGGVASVMDLGCTLVEYNTSLTPEQADAIALSYDWYFVGEDLRAACREFARQQAEGVNCARA